MKAQSMSIGVVITAALAVMVLLMVGGFMSGGFGAMTSKITGFVSSGPSAEATGGAVACGSACATWKDAQCPAKLGDGDCPKDDPATTQVDESDCTPPRVLADDAQQGSVFKAMSKGCCSSAASYTESGSKVTCGACSCSNVGAGGAWGT